MTSPWLASGFAPSAVPSSAKASSSPGRNADARNTAAWVPAHPLSSACSTKRLVSSTQVASRTTPARRKSSQDARAASAAALSRTPRPCADISTRQPAPSAIAVVASREPASATITSRTMPAAAPETNAASVGNSARSLSCVAITTLSMIRCPSSAPDTAFIYRPAPRAEKEPPRFRSPAEPPVGLPPLHAAEQGLCSCFVRCPKLGSSHGSLVCSRQTPAGAHVLLAQPPCAGGRLCPPSFTLAGGDREAASRRRRPRYAGRGRGRGRRRSPPRPGRAVERHRPLRAARSRRLRRRLAKFRGAAAVQDLGDHRLHP